MLLKNTMAQINFSLQIPVPCEGRPRHKPKVGTWRQQLRQLTGRSCLLVGSSCLSQLALL